MILDGRDVDPRQIPERSIGKPSIAVDRPVHQGIEHQQNVAGFTVSVVVMVAPGNDVDDLRPLLSSVENTLTVVRPGEIIRVGG